MRTWSVALFASFVIAVSGCSSPSEEGEPEGPVAPAAPVGGAGEPDAPPAAPPSGQPERPTLSAVEPAQGSTAGGSLVAIHGSGLSGGANRPSVFFGDVEAEVVESAATRITVVAPAASTADKVDVRVELEHGSAKLEGAYEYFDRRYQVVSVLGRSFTPQGQRALVGFTAVTEPTTTYPLPKVGSGCPAAGVSVEEHLASLGIKSLKAGDSLELRRTGAGATPLVSELVDAVEPRYAPVPSQFDRFVAGTYDFEAPAAALAGQATFVAPPSFESTSPKDGDVDGGKSAPFAWKAPPNGSVTYTELVAYEGTTARFRCVSTSGTLIQVPPAVMAPYRGKTLAFVLAHAKVTEAPLTTGSYAASVGLNATRREIRIK